MKYDVFISYRRDGGLPYASVLKEHLQNLGYAENRVFLDLDSLGPGKYKPNLIQSVQDSNNVVVLITKGCFENLEKHQDWLDEIEAAIREKKNIVPIDYDEIKNLDQRALPEVIKELLEYQASRFDPQKLKESASSLLKYLIKDPDIENTETKTPYVSRKSARRASTVAAGLLCALILSFFTNKLLLHVNPLNGQGLVISNKPVLVDLGLPSGTRWLDRNIGADNYYDYGKLYAFREIYTRSYFTREEYMIDHNSAKERERDRSDYDVAWVKSKGKWRLPTVDEFRELIRYCRWEEVEREGVPGRLVTGPNGKAIFLPAAGMKKGEDHQYMGEYGYYWTEDFSSGQDKGEELLFAPVPAIGDAFVYYGRSVRPVKN